MKPTRYSGLTFLFITITGIANLCPAQINVVNKPNSVEIAIESLKERWFLKNEFKTKAKAVSADQIQDSIFLARINDLPTDFEIDFNEHVKEKIVFYTRSRRTESEIILGLAGRYVIYFEQSLKDYGLPTDLKYLPIPASALNNFAVSSNNCSGFWQLPYPIAKKYKLTTNDFIDERRSLLKASDVAARYIKSLYEKYGDWRTTIAAFYCSPASVTRAIKRSGKTNLWDFYEDLPEKERSLIPAFYASAYLNFYYKDHGLVPREIELPTKQDTIILKKDLHFESIINVLDIPVDLLVSMNPTMRNPWIKVDSNSAYSLLVPVEYKALFVNNMDSIYYYQDSILFRKADIIESEEPIVVAPKDMKQLTYIVKSGDNLGFISEWYDVGLSKLKAWNDIEGSRIDVGQKLIVFVPKEKIKNYEHINSSGAKEKPKTVKLKPKDPVSSNSEDDDFVYYKVRSGDSLYKIALRYPGISSRNIQDLNNITGYLQPGQILKIKRKEE